MDRKPESSEPKQSFALCYLVLKTEKQRTSLQLPLHLLGTHHKPGVSPAKLPPSSSIQEHAKLSRHRTQRAEMFSSLPDSAEPTGGRVVD